MKLITKVVKGVAYGDVSNQAIRNILTEISKSINGSFTEQEMYDTMDFFGWRCPYTGRDLRKSLKDGDGSYATDHIYPQNREWCGLNVKGNLVIVDKKANAAKRDKDVETFLLTDTKELTDIDLQGLTRAQRLQKIKDFQALCGYDPDKIRTVISPILKARYDVLRDDQEACISHTLDELKGIGVKTITKPTLPAVTVSTTAGKSKRKKGNSRVELVFCPADEEQFKTELLKRKSARFVLTYDSGAVKTTSWDASKFKITSDLRGNIESKTFWRNAGKEGLVRVEVFID